jgi:hypothetical protein
MASKTFLEAVPTLYLSSNAPIVPFEIHIDAHEPKKHRIIFGQMTVDGKVRVVRLIPAPDVFIEQVVKFE